MTHSRADQILRSSNGQSTLGAFYSLLNRRLGAGHRTSHLRVSSVAIKYLREPTRIVEGLSLRARCHVCGPQCVSDGICLVMPLSSQRRRKASLFRFERRGRMMRNELAEPRRITVAGQESRTIKGVKACDGEVGGVAEVVAPGSDEKQLLVSCRHSVG